MTAAQQVFDTFELFETIMLDVDMRTLLLAQRVSKSFQQAVNNSKPLQRALFFQLTPQHLREAQPTKNPLLFDKKTQGRIGIKLMRTREIYNTSHPFYLTTVAFDEQDKLRKLSQDASWRRMLIKQPGLTTALERWEISRYAGKPYGGYVQIGGEWAANDWYLGEMVKMAGAHVASVVSATYTSSSRLSY